MRPIGSQPDWVLNRAWGIKALYFSTQYGKDAS